MRIWLPCAFVAALTTAVFAGERAWYDDWDKRPGAERCRLIADHLAQEPRRLHLRSATVRFVDLAPAKPDGDVPWLLIHGYAGNLCDYGAMLARVAEHHRVLAFDLPGFGESVGADERYSVYSYMRTLREFIQQIGVERVHLVCHSLGGHVCIGAALGEPRYIATLTLIDTAGIYEQTDFIKTIAKRTAKLNVGPMGNNPRRSPLAWTVGEQEFLRRFVVADPTVMAAVSSFRTNFRSQMGELRIRTLILWGMEDPLFPVEDALFLKENVPDSELHIIEQARHCPIETHPGVVVDMIERFIRKREDPGP